MTPLKQIGLWALVLAALFGGYQGWAWHVRQQGALKVLLHQADSAKVVADSVQKAEHAEHLKAVADADALRRLARVEVKRDSAVQAKHDSTTQAVADARSQAERTLADSLSGLADLRRDLEHLVQRSRADSSAAARERDRAAATVRALLLTIQADSTAIAKGIAAENAAVARAVLAERQRDIIKKQMPSKVGRWTERVLSLTTIVYFAKK